ncbi:MAG: DUF1131 family protein [Parvibaculaceae bacterium]|nr:DUF1131 family protein [Parvibaculaceae bacterium]
MNLFKTLLAAASLSLLAACQTPPRPLDPIQVSNNSVGNLWAQTPFSPFAVQKAFPRYQVNMGQNSEGQIAILVAAGDDVVLNIIPTQNKMWISAVVVVGQTAVGPDGVQIGMPFASIYQNKMPSCKADTSEMGAYGDSQSTGLIMCPAPGASQLVYYFKGTGADKKTGMPSPAAAASWSLSAIIWNTNNPEDTPPAS